MKKVVLVPSYPEGFRKVTNLFQRSNLEISHELKHLYTLQCKYLTEAQKCFIFVVSEEDGKITLGYGKYTNLSGYSNIQSFNRAFDVIKIKDIEYLDDIKSIDDIL